MRCAVWIVSVALLATPVTSQDVYAMLTATPTEVRVGMNPTTELVIDCLYNGSAFDLASVTLSLVNSPGANPVSLVTINKNVNPLNPQTLSALPAGSTTSFTDNGAGKPTGLTLNIADPDESYTGEYVCQIQPDNNANIRFHTIVEVTFFELDQTTLINILANLSSELARIRQELLTPPPEFTNQTVLALLEDLEEENANLTTELDTANDLLASLTEQIEALENKTADTREQALENWALFDYLESLHASNNESILDLFEEIDELNNATGLASLRVDDVNEELDALGGQLNDTELAVQANNASIAEKEEKLDNLTAEVEAITEALRNVTESLELAECKANETTQQVTILRESLYTVSDQLNNSRYIVTQFSPASFNQAEDMCAQLGGILAEIDTQEENDFIAQFLEPIISIKQYILFGAIFQNEAYQNRFSGGDVGYVDFFTGRPDNAPGTTPQNCLAYAKDLFGMEGIKMDNIQCDFIHERDYEWIHGALCEVPAVAMVDTCGTA